MAKLKHKPLIEWQQYPLDPDKSIDIRCQTESVEGATFRELLWFLETDRHQLEIRAEARFVGIRWPDGIRCPQANCGSSNVQEFANGQTMSYLCDDCLQRFSATSGTLLDWPELDCLTLLMAGYMTVAHCQDVVAGQLAECLEIDEQTACRLGEVFRRAIADSDSAPFAATRSTSGRVEPLALTLAALAVVLRGNDPNAGHEVVSSMGHEGANAVPGDCDGEKAPVRVLARYRNDSLFRLGPLLEYLGDGPSRILQEPAREGDAEYAPDAPDRRTSVAIGGTRKVANKNDQDLAPMPSAGPGCLQLPLLAASSGNPARLEPARLADLKPERGAPLPAVTARKRKPQRPRRRVGGAHKAQLPLW